MAHSLQLLPIEVVDTDSIVLGIEVIFQLAVAFSAHIELPEIVPPIVSEVEIRIWLHPVIDLLDHVEVLLGSDCR